jgi:hypothetical protein
VIEPNPDPTLAQLRELRPFAIFDFALDGSQGYARSSAFIRPSHGEQEGSLIIT